MACHGRPLCLVHFALACGLLASLGWAEPSYKPPGYHRAMQEDAELADVMFVEGEHGWAVGDRGVIWHTSDGGKTWALQPTRIDCRLSSVWFVDARLGWVVGAMTDPYTHTMRGVLLTTRDGGRSWKQDASGVLPAAKRVRFFDKSRGWILGESGPLAPEGVLVTEDGGNSWKAAAGLSAQGWLTGDFTSTTDGAIAGRRGAVATVQRRGLKQANSPLTGLRGFNQLRLSQRGIGWLVGDGGLVFFTDDEGNSWQVPPGGVEELASDQFDWRALAVRGDRCWIAGTPGSRILHTSDAGLTWQLLDTGQNAPILGLSFVDDRHGWAVGAFGTILATTDGGQTWQRQRAGGSRAAVLGFFSTPDRIPLEALARLAANDGYLSVVDVLNRCDQEPGFRLLDHASGEQEVESLPDRTRDAMVSLGASASSTAWAFPLRQAGLNLSGERIMAGWNLANDGRGLERIESWLVREIRCWRPEVILTHSASPAGDDPLGHVINQIVLRAVDQAADPTRFTEQRTLLNLEPWKVRKVFGCLPAERLGSVNVTTAQLSPRLGRSLADFCSRARGLLQQDFAVPPANWGFSLFLNQVSQTVASEDFFGGITLHPGTEARRNLADYEPIEGADLLRRAAQRHRNVQAILTRTRSPRESAALIAQIDDLTSGLDRAAGAELLYQLAQNYHHTGRWRLSAETLDLLIQRYPEHPLTCAALVWMVQYWSSTEAAWRDVRQGASARKEVADASTARTPATALGQVLSKLDAQARSTNSSGKEDKPLLDSHELSARAARAAEYARQLEQMSPAAFLEPSVQFPLARARQAEGFSQQAERFYLECQRLHARDAWGECANTEFWLQDHAELPAKSMLHARIVDKPRLDGRLDDAAWADARPVDLLSSPRDDEEWPAQVRVAYDREFLFLGIHCRKSPQTRYESTAGPRTRDPDLSSHDRVEICLDLDRDWTTFHRLTLDHRGWVADSCWGDATWDPIWFVAREEDETSWTIEAALPLVELTGQMPRASSVWSLGIQRVVPGTGFQSWTTPASTTFMPQGFGLLIFD